MGWHFHLFIIAMSLVWKLQDKKNTISQLIRLSGNLSRKKLHFTKTCLEQQTITHRLRKKKRRQESRRHLKEENQDKSCMIKSWKMVQKNKKKALRDLEKKRKQREEARIKKEKKRAKRARKKKKGDRVRRSKSKGGKKKRSKSKKAKNNDMTGGRQSSGKRLADWGGD